MKKLSARLLSLALTLVLIFSLCSTAFAAKVIEEQPFRYYAALGDSIPWHVGADVPEITRANGFRETVYPTLVYDRYHLPDGFYGTRCGWRPQELLLALDPSVKPDDYSVNFLPHWGGMTVDQIRSWSGSYIAAIKKADLITMNFGSNNLLGTFTYYNEKIVQILTDRTMGTPLQRLTLDVIRAAMQKRSPESIFYTLLDFASSFLCGIIEKETLVSDLTNAMMEFPDAWDAVIRKIRELNPDALIVVTSVYNPDKSISAQNIISQSMINYMNSYMKTLSPLSREYTFVNTGLPDLTGTRGGSHLGTVGHQEVAGKIIKAIDAKLPCTHPHTELVKARAATKLLPGYTGDLRCTDCGETLQKGSVCLWHCTHSETVRIGERKPTKLLPGSTGTLSCRECGKILETAKLYR